MTFSQRLLGEAVSLLEDPIVAISSAAGHGAVGLVRLSGSAERVDEVLHRLLGEQEACSLQARRMHLRSIYHPGSGQLLDRGLVVRFPGPSSYTGEDLVEFHLHGNPLLLERVQASLCTAGARLARAGEFTRRAVRNGRMSLLQAEAIDALVRAEGEAGLELARRHLGGELPERVGSWREALLGVAAGLEALVDFPDEVDERALQTELAALPALVTEMKRLLTTFRAGRRLVAGTAVVLRGPVNAGKSTLFNGLVGHSRAIVSARAGTTRDVISETVLWSGLSIRLEDTAGMGLPADAIEAEGIARSDAAAELADVVLQVRDARSLPGTGEQPTPEPEAVLWVASHCDCIDEQQRKDLQAQGWLLTCAPRGDGLDQLRQRLVAQVRSELPGDGLVLHTARQQGALAAALESVGEAQSHGDDEPVLAAVALRGAGRALEELAGRWQSEEVLDELFKRFCIGK